LPYLAAFAAAPAAAAAAALPAEYLPAFSGLGLRGDDPAEPDRLGGLVLMYLKVTTAAYQTHHLQPLMASTAAGTVDELQAHETNKQAAQHT
jgi:hypothetical protein